MSTNPFLLFSEKPVQRSLIPAFFGGLILLVLFLLIGSNVATITGGAAGTAGASAGAAAGEGGAAGGGSIGTSGSNAGVGSGGGGVSLLGVSTSGVIEQQLPSKYYKY